MMGFFLYDNSRAIAIDDRVLAHLQIVIIDKLRRRESFAFNLRSDGTIVMMWLTCSAPLQFVYEGNRRPRINWPWVELLAAEAGLRGTLELLPEPILSDVTAAVPLPEVLEPLKPLRVELEPVELEPA
jgi:hypothetical protein